MTDESHSKSVLDILASGMVADGSGTSDPPEYDLKRWEEFYKYAQDSYERAHDRWTAADEKTSKYLSILGVLIGAGALTVGQVAEIVAGAQTYGDWAFVVLYIGAGGFAITSFVLFLSAIQLQGSSAPPTRKEMLEFFESNRYVDVLYGLGRETLAAADRTRLTVEKKFQTADHGFLTMRIAGAFLLMASLAYFNVQVRNATNNAKDNASADSAVTRESRSNDAGPDSRGPGVRPSEGEFRGSQDAESPQAQD